MRTLLLNLNCNAMDHLGAGQSDRIRMTVGPRGTLFIDVTSTPDVNTFPLYRKGTNGRNGNFVIPKDVAAGFSIVPGFRYAIGTRRSVDGYPLTMLAPIPLPGEAGHKTRFDQPIISISERRYRGTERSSDETPEHANDVTQSIESLYRVVGRMNRHISRVLKATGDTKETRQVEADIHMVTNQIRSLMMLVSPLPRADDPVSY